MAVRPLDLNKRNPATIVPFDAMAVERCGAGANFTFMSALFARYEKDGGYLPPSPRARLPCPASEAPLVRGFFVCKASHRGFVNFVTLTPPGQFPPTSWWSGGHSNL
jgi:hypothetical protein